MPNSDWLFFVAVGGILAFGLAFSALQYERQNECSRCYATSAQQQEGAGERAYMAFSRDAIVQAPPPNPEPSREEWREEQDLEAQWSMADWAFWMMLFSGVGVAVTALGVVYVARTLDTSKDAVAAARENADIARQAMVADKRAWLVINGVRLIPPTNFSGDFIDINAEVEIENIGPTPAKSVWVNITHYLIEKNQDGAFKRAETRFLQGLRINPPQLGDVIVPHQKFFNRTRWPIVGEALKDTPLAIFVGVTYRVFGDDTARITYRAFDLMKVPVGFVVPEGKVGELHPLPFMPGEID